MTLVNRLSYPLSTRLSFLASDSEIEIDQKSNVCHVFITSVVSIAIGSIFLKPIMSQPIAIIIIDLRLCAIYFIACAQMVDKIEFEQKQV